MVSYYSANASDVPRHNDRSSNEINEHVYLFVNDAILLPFNRCFFGRAPAEFNSSLYTGFQIERNIIHHGRLLPVSLLPIYDLFPDRMRAIGSDDELVNGSGCKSGDIITGLRRVDVRIPNVSESWLVCTDRETADFFHGIPGQVDPRTTDFWCEQNFGIRIDSTAIEYQIGIGGVAIARIVGFLRCHSKSVIGSINERVANDVIGVVLFHRIRRRGRTQRYPIRRVVMVRSYPFDPYFGRTQAFQSDVPRNSRYEAYYNYDFK